MEQKNGILIATLMREQRYSFSELLELATDINAFVLLNCKIERRAK
jgi:hypothetical protein